MGAARGTTAKTRPRPTGSAQPYGHVFKATLEELLIGATMAYWVVFLPAKLQRKAPFAAGKKLRMRGVVGGVHGRLVAMAWQLSGGRHYLMFGRATARSLGLALGDEVDVAFSIVVDDDVDVPEELAEALSQEPAWTKLWAALTPSARRAPARWDHRLQRRMTTLPKCAPLARVLVGVAGFVEREDAVHHLPRRESL